MPIGAVLVAHRALALRKLKIVRISNIEVFWCQIADFAMLFVETVRHDSGRDSQSDKSSATIRSGILVGEEHFL